MKSLTVWRIRFKRSKSSPWEPGLMIGKDIEDYNTTSELYDADGVRVEGILWEYGNQYYKGVTTFNMDDE